MLASEKLTQGSIYTRNELSGLFKTNDATIRTGLFKPQGYSSIFLFITEEKEPHQVQYKDSLDGDELRIEGQTSGRTNKTLINHVSSGDEVLLFHRKSKSEYPNFGFKYEGLFQYVSHTGEKPASFVFSRKNENYGIASDLESMRIEEEFFEGEKKARFSNYYERNPRLRFAAISIHGYRCFVCDFDFEEKYGLRGKGYIEIHHLHPVSSLKIETKIDPKSDLVPVCSNCHRMIHRKKDGILSVSELRILLKKKSG